MKIKRILSMVIVYLMCFIILPLGICQKEALAQDLVKVSNINELKPYDDIRGKDLSELNLKDQVELLYKLDFDTYTKWPGKDKMPQKFEPLKLLEAGKNPGLGIRKLQQQGYLGNGVAIAYIDQHLLLNHEAYKNVNLHNYDIQTDRIQPSMHGPAVLSLLSGKEIGLVPNAEVYFFGHDGNEDDNEFEARAFEKIIELNKTLYGNKKIKIVGMSHGIDESLNVEYAKHLRVAEEAARKSGIIVIDVSMDMATCGIGGFQDRDDYKNYQISNWEKQWQSDMFKGRLIVPADFRTTAAGYKSEPNHYIYWGNGGFSWGVPYITGVITMGLQINSNLTEKEALQFLHEGSNKYLNEDMINPEGFLNLVKQNCANPNDVSLDKDYRYFLYNKNRISEQDLKSITEYTNKFNDGTTSILKDVSGYTSAPDIYEMLKNDSKSKNGTLKGIQIFGTSNDVPAFDVHFKIQMKDSVDDSGNFKSDFFYSNFKNDSNSLKNDFSIYKAFSEKLNISFMPEWTVSRLPLIKGEIAPFINKNSEYVASVKDKPFGNFVNFSNSIFASSNHSDDLGYFLKERMDKEFNILSSSDYKLYGNKQGTYPVNTEVIGDFTKENIAKENKDGIKAFIINTHGQENNIDQCIYTSKDSSSEKRISFMNKDNINNVLSENYYNLDLWTCLNGYNLDGKNLVHEAIANGKCISAMAASSVISNNGVHNDVSLENMKKNNFYYFYLKYLYNRALGKTRSESFNSGKQAYVQEILKNTDMLNDGNYQFNLHNVLSYHYFGLIEYWDYSGKSDFNPKMDGSGDSDNQTAFDGNIKFSSNYSGGGFKVNYFKAERVGNTIEFTLDYESSGDCDYSFFNPPNGDKIMKILNSGIKKGTNSTKFNISMEEFSKVLSVDYIGMRFGFDDNFNFIDFNTSQLKPLLTSSSNNNKVVNDSDSILC
ncbi:hypothetical protein K9O30_01820 [Clostridium bowmanii]|uniref:hypothetical protein n=1 Tax=Clostridium bowmanii TaxID=132925 RepID=UPI001C0D9996|nr:hypothetical protein [Clostridium bowmanii]MBU3190292.1 hypothetical protein [Clostridium bowmanii]MCA1072496.1 hypothetical protein [Clostridium bowmanii]